MNYLLQSITVFDTNSKYHKKTVDVLIENGIITNIKRKITAPSKAEVIDGKELMLLPGFMDISVRIGEPGNEQREDFESIERSAIAGGFTSIGIWPDNSPITETKASVNYIKNASKGKAINFHPIGALTAGLKGKDLSEMYDLNQVGTKVFSNDYHAITDKDVLSRALQYVLNIEGTVMNTLHDIDTVQETALVEGPLAVKMGLNGISEFQEATAVDLNLKLLEYTASKLHLWGITEAQSINKIKQSKKKFSGLTCSASILNLLETENALKDYNEQFKVYPPLRTIKDVKQLKKSAAQGDIDILTANHHPVEIEAKDLEYVRSQVGMIGLETFLPLYFTDLSEDISLERLLDLCCYNPRKLFQLSIPEINVGHQAELTLVNPTESWIYSEEMIASKSKNTAYLNREFKGRVRGIFNNKELYLA